MTHNRKKKSCDEDERSEDGHVKFRGDWLWEWEGTHRLSWLTCGWMSPHDNRTCLKTQIKEEKKINKRTMMPGGGEGRGGELWWRMRMLPTNSIQAWDDHQWWASTSGCRRDSGQRSVIRTFSCSTSRILHLCFIDPRTNLGLANIPPASKCVKHVT